MSTLSQEEIQKLITDNVGLAMHIASKWGDIPGHDRDDIKQQALAGLVKAANQYDPEKGKFSSYAGKAIRNHLGHISFRGKKISNAEKQILDAPMDPSGEGDGDSTGHEFFEDSSSLAIPASVTADKNDAIQLVRAEIDAITNPDRRAMVVKWLNGETYRELQAQFGVSQTMVMHYIRDEMAAIKSRLARKGISGPGGVLEGLKDGDGITALVDLIDFADTVAVAPSSESVAEAVAHDALSQAGFYSRKK